MGTNNIIVVAEVSGGRESHLFGERLDNTLRVSIYRH